MGILYMVATPIGNLEDISFRALRILREAVLIAAEDTRRTRALLEHFDIHAPLTSYFEHNKIQKMDRILEALAEGDVALVSDAGTPLLNDPGYELAQAALKAGVEVRPVPGPSAPIAALTASGLPVDSFLYLGYLPHKAGERRKAAAEVASLPHTLIFLETPHRLRDSLADLLSALGERRICVAREMTKLHEEYWRGNISGAIEYFNSKEPRGEFTLVVEGKRSGCLERWTQEALMSAVRELSDEGKPAKQISAELAEISGWGRKEIYELIHRSGKK
jgi:16S rRNA (cytidine1402-2'-O)-methyltransferase